jgi:type II secretory pathway component PulK
MSKKGSVLIISLWIAAILVLFTFGLAHRASLNLKIARNQKNRLKAYNLAKAGINKAIMLAQEDSLDSETKDYDTVLECGVNLKGREPQEIFSENLPAAEEGFRVGFYNDSGEFVYGSSDEESKINVASICLAILLEERQVEAGAELAQTIHSWTTQESSLDNLGSAEIPKKEPLHAPEELILALEYFFSSKNILNAKEKAKGEYEKFKDFVTIYGNNKINVNTATAETLDNLASAFTLQNNLQIDTLALAQRIIELRGNPQRKYYKDLAQLQQDVQDDQNLDVEQKGFFTSFLLPHLKCRCDYLRIRSIGYVGSLAREINMVYDRLAKRVVYWREN